MSLVTGIKISALGFRREKISTDGVALKRAEGERYRFEENVFENSEWSNKYETSWLCKLNWIKMFMFLLFRYNLPRFVRVEIKLWFDEIFNNWALFKATIFWFTFPQKNWTLIDFRSKFTTPTVPDESNIIVKLTNMNNYWSEQYTHREKEFLHGTFWNMSTWYSWYHMRSVLDFST